MENFDNFRVRVFDYGKTKTHHPQKNWVVVSNFSFLYLHPFLMGNDPISRTYFVRCGFVQPPTRKQSVQDGHVDFFY